MLYNEPPGAKPSGITCLVFQESTTDVHLTVLEPSEQGKNGSGGLSNSIRIIYYGRIQPPEATGPPVCGVG